MARTRTTMMDIARRAGVSKNTVSLALRHDRQIPEATRERIVKIARTLGYQKNATVAHLMTALRRSRVPRFQSCLALLNANLDKDAFRSHPTVPTYIQGCEERAHALGYRLDEFWLHDPSLDGTRLNKVLYARGISGVIVVGLMRESRLPGRFLPTWEKFPNVVTGVRTRDPALSFACTDHYMLALTAVQEGVALGYRRPALVIDPVIDRLVDGRFSAGAQAALQALPASRRPRPFYPEGDSKEVRASFRHWLDREKPDLILTLYNVVRHWLESDGWRIPGDFGMIQLEWRTSSDWAGMNQHNEVVGQAAVEMLVGMIHGGNAGVPDFPRATLIGSTWKPGDTVRPQRD